MSDSLRRHELQHTRHPCPSPTPTIYPNPCPLVGDAIQSSHPLSSPSPPAFNLSQHQGLFKWVSSSHQLAKVLVFQLQHQSFQWTRRTDLLYDGLVGSPCSPRYLQKSSPTPELERINSLSLSFLHSPTLTSIHAAAAAAKLLQLCPTLCDPIDSSPPGSSVTWIIQARILEWVAISFSTPIYDYWKNHNFD